MWNERTKQDRHEIPVGVQYQETRYGSLSDDTTLWDAHRPPANPYEALMVQGDTPADALMLQDAFSNIETAIKHAGLTERETAVIELVVFGGMSLAEAGRWLGPQFRDDGKPFHKMTVSKLRDSAYVKLRKVFKQ